MFKRNKTNSREASVNNWYAWYESAVSDFHLQRLVEHNGELIDLPPESLNMAKQVSSDWVFLLTQEIEYNEEYEQVEEFYNDTKNNMSLFLEGVMCTGQGLAVYVGDELNLYDARQYVIGFEDVNGVRYKSYEVQIENDKRVVYAGNYVITKIDGDTQEYVQPLRYVPYKELTFIKDLQYFEGKSVFADAIPVLKQIDLSYSDMNEDRDYSRPMLIADDGAYRTTFEPPTEEELETNPEAKGKVKQWLHKGKRLFKGIKGSNKPLAEQSPVEKINFQMQIDSYVTTLNTHLALFSKKCKLGDDYYSFDKNTGNVKTATEVIDKNSDLARNLRKFREIYKSFQKEYYEQLFGVELEDSFVTFGDGIMTDDRYEREADRKDIAELDTPQLQVDYLVRWHGYEEGKAEELVYTDPYNNGNDPEGLLNPKGEETVNKENNKTLPIPDK